MFIKNKEIDMSICESCAHNKSLHFNYIEGLFECKEATFSHDEIDDECYYYIPKKNTLPLDNCTVSIGNKEIEINSDKEGL